MKEKSVALRKVEENAESWLKEQADAIKSVYIASWLEAGRRLKDVRDRIANHEIPQFKSVHEWADQELRFKKAHCYQLIKGWTLYESMKSESAMVDSTPAEHAVRPLFRLKAAEQQESAWKRAEEIAGTPAFTQVHAKQAVVEILGTKADTDDDRRPKVATANDIKYVASGWISELKESKDIERLRDLRVQLSLAAKAALAAEEELNNG